MASTAAWPRAVGRNADRDAASVFEWLTLAGMALSIADLQVKLFWDYGPATLAACAVAFLVLYGLRRMTHPALLGVASIPFLVFLSYLLNYDSMTAAFSPDFDPRNQLVIAVAFGCFTLARLTQSAIRRIMIAIVLGSCCAVAIGWFRYVTGTGGNASEHALNYWGILYGPSTRNSDVMYPLIILMFSEVRGLGRYKLALMAFAFPAVVLSMSRSAWLASAIFFARRGGWPIVIAAGLILVMTVLWTGGGESLIARFASILETGGTASNNERARLIQYAFTRVTPFGHGPFGFSDSGIAYFGLPPLFHAENFFLTFAIEYGVFAIGVFLAVWGWTILHMPNRRVGIMFSVYLMMNSQTDNVLVWLLFGLFMQTAFCRTLGSASPPGFQPPSLAWRSRDVGQSHPATRRRPAGPRPPGRLPSVGG